MSSWLPHFLRADATFLVEGDAAGGAPLPLLLPLARARDVLAADATTARSALGDELGPYFVVYCTCFYALYLISPWLLRSTFGPGYSRLDAKAQDASRAYVFSLAHHVVACAIALQTIWLDFGFKVVVPSRMAATIPFSAAYLAADLVHMFPEALRTRTVGYIPHHLLGFGVTVAVLYAPLRLMRYAAHLTVCELSSFFLAALWACDKGAVPLAAPPHVLAQLGFLIVFTLTRVVNLPIALATVALVYPRDWDTIGILGQLSLLGIVLLQWYWFAKIVRRLVRTTGGAASGGKGAAMPHEAVKTKVRGRRRSTLR